MTGRGVELTAWEAKVAGAVLLARADGRYELSERDALSAYISPYEPAEPTLLESGGLVIETVLSLYGMFEQWLTFQDIKEDLEEVREETAPDGAGPAYDAYAQLLEKMEAARPPLALLQACRAALSEPKDRVDALALAYDVARADGQVDPEEHALFQTLTSALGATAEEVDRARKTVEEMSAFGQEMDEALEHLTGEKAVAHAPTLTPTEAVAAVVALALPDDAALDVADLKVVQPYCERAGLPLEGFQTFVRQAQELRERRGPLGLLSACATTLRGTAQRDEALELARTVMRAHGGVGQAEEDLYQLIEDALT